MTPDGRGVCLCGDAEGERGDLHVGHKLGEHLAAAGFREITMGARYECYPSLRLIGEYLARQLEEKGEHGHAQTLRWSQSERRPVRPTGFWQSARGSGSIFLHQLKGGAIGAMIIRPAEAPAIARRLGQRGYPVSEDMVRSKLALLLKSMDEDLLVGEDGGNVVGFLAMHSTSHKSPWKGLSRASNRPLCR